MSFVNCEMNILKGNYLENKYLHWIAKNITKKPLFSDDLLLIQS